MQTKPSRGPVTASGVRILLVEDEASLREIVRDLLAEAGYDVLDTGSSDDALRLATSSQRPIDLLITDVVLPRMSGGQLATRLLELRLCREVIYMSGYTDDVVARHGVPGRGVRFLHKPFTPDALLTMVREAVGDSEPA